MDDRLPVSAAINQLIVFQDLGQGFPEGGEFKTKQKIRLFVYLRTLRIYLHFNKQTPHAPEFNDF